MGIEGMELSKTDKDHFEIILKFGNLLKILNFKNVFFY
jgi:hypothetical protein